MHNELLEDMDSLLDQIKIFFYKNDEDIIYMNKLSKNKHNEFLPKLNYRKLTRNLWSKLSETFVN